MPKKKSKRMARRRLRLTAKGKIKRSHAFKGHILTKKHPKRKRHLRKATLVSRGDRRLLKLLQV